MNTTLLVILLSVAAVAIFVLGMSLTLMIKGRNIDSEIDTNENMRRLGIRCAVKESMTPREREMFEGCSGKICSDCDSNTEETDCRS